MEYRISSPYSGGVTCNSCNEIIDVINGFYHCPDCNCEEDYHLECLKDSEIAN
jgi:hypothetical protein